MKITISKTILESDVIIIPLFKNTKLSSEVLNYFDSSQSLLKKIIVDFIKDLSEVSSVFIDKHKILLLGLGEKAEFKAESLRRAAAESRKVINKFKAKKVSIIFESLNSSAFIQAFIEGFILGGYNFNKYITAKKTLTEIDHLHFVSASHNLIKTAEEAQILADNVSYVRDLVNTPPIDMAPKDLVVSAKKLAKESSQIKTSILGRNQISSLGMGALKAVGQGSSEEEQLIILEYKYQPRNKKPILLVGKGLTFDSGGINLKPSGSGSYSLEELKCDMAGAATVLGIFKTLARLKLPLHVVGIIPAAENMPDGKAIKPGDIIKSYAGKTIEIINTDAEGRLVLADAIAYGINKFNPELIIDIATLTGASIIALGREITAMMSNDEKITDKLKLASKNTGEKIWEMPLDKDYTLELKSDIADLRNLSREVFAGVIMGGLFLEQFINHQKWVHLDIGGSAWSVSNKNYVSKGGTGNMLRLLWEFLKNY